MQMRDHLKYNRYMEKLVVHSLDTYLLKSRNTLTREEDGTWQIRFQDGTRIPVPERQGKELFVLLRASERMAEQDREFDFSDLDPKSVDEYILTRADCFRLVARALVELPLRHAVDAETVDYIKLFKNDQYHVYSSIADLEEELKSVFAQGDIAVGQVLEEGGSRVTHSMLVVQGKSRLFLIQKSGGRGPAYIGEFEAGLFKAMQNAYGRRMAFASFDDIAKSPMVKRRLSNPPRRLFD